MLKSNLRVEDTIDVTWLTDDEIQSRVEGYLDGNTLDIEPVLLMASKVFYAKMKAYRSSTWYSRNASDIKSDFNVFFYESLSTYDRSRGVFLAYLYSNMPHFINNLFYAYTEGSGYLDRNLLTIRNYALKFNGQLPGLLKLSNEEYRKEILRLITLEKKENYMLSGFNAGEAEAKALKFVVTSGLKAAVKFLPNVLTNSSTLSLEKLKEVDPSFDLVENEALTPSSDLDKILFLALGREIWAAEALFEYLGLGLESDSPLSKIADERSYSKKELSAVLSASFNRIQSPIAHFCYLTPVEIEDESLSNRLAPSVFSDF